MLLKITLLVTAVLTALISGFFYAYTCSVNLGLGRLGDAEYIRAMQSINRTVLNPVFFASFFGTLVMLPICAWVIYKTAGSTTGFCLVVAAGFIYFFGVFLVTGVGNVPLNDSLNEVNVSMSSLIELNEQRKAFEIPWNRLNLIRTVANLVALVLLLIAQLNIEKY